MCDPPLSCNSGGNTGFSHLMAIFVELSRRSTCDYDDDAMH